MTLILIAPNATILDPVHGTTFRSVNGGTVYARRTLTGAGWEFTLDTPDGRKTELRVDTVHVTVMNRLTIASLTPHGA